MTCEICGEPTRESNHVEAPADEGYVSVTLEDDESPTGYTTYRFCSLEHAQMFSEPVEAV